MVLSPQYLRSSPDTFTKWSPTRMKHDVYAAIAAVYLLLYLCVQNNHPIFNNRTKRTQHVVYGQHMWFCCFCVRGVRCNVIIIRIYYTSWMHGRQVVFLDQMLPLPIAPMTMMTTTTHEKTAQAHAKRVCAINTATQFTRIASHVRHNTVATVSSTALNML